MKKTRIGMVLVIFLTIWAIFMNTKTVGAPALTYVYSESMEPLIQVNDGFFVVPTMKSEVGDIIVFRPTVMDAELVTHRIVGVGSEGFITQGDNLNYTDQEKGELEVKQENIVGKVFMINQTPITIKNLGTFIDIMNQHKSRFNLVGVFFLIAGFIFWLIDWQKKTNRERKSRKRRRLWALGRNMITLLSVILLFHLLYGERIEKTSYLISTNPSDPDIHFGVNQSGKMNFLVKNRSFLPVWYLPEGSSNLSLEEVPELIPPFSEEKMILGIKPHKETGWYHAYVKSYIYPILLPRNVLIRLHAIHPVFSAFATTLTFYGLLLGMFRSSFWLLDIYPHTPVKAINMKEMRPYTKKIKAKAGLDSRRR